MKKSLLGFVTVLIVLAASLALAANASNINAGYYSSAGSKAMTAASVLALPPTNITVLNYSEERIFVAVPNVFEYEIPTGNSRTIAHDSYYGDTSLILSDWNHNRFWESTVCRRAIVVVDGRPGNYHISVDRKFC
ncbi:MAG: hypothetical protein KIT56_00035 [Gammaproteobacteria bacterium]|nr:hypothetical protein [Gammaproteobacteria bacterium]MCW5582273.1 hypothetical protein [Gammaproteobacteria bacterium]